MLEDLFDHLLILDETDDLHPPLTFGASQGVRLPRSSRGQAPIFWINLAQFFLYFLAPSSDIRIQGMASSRFSLPLFPRETLLCSSRSNESSVQPCLGHANPWPRAIQGHQRPFPVSHLWNNRSPWIPRKGRSSSPGRKRPE